MHVILSEDVPWISFFVQIGTAVIKATSSLQEKSAVLRSPERSMHQSPVEHVLVNRQDRDGGFPISLILDVC